MASPFNSEGGFLSPHIKFSHLISVKLDEKNSKQWKQQIEGVIRGHKLQRFVTTPLVPQRFLPGADPVTGGVNPSYLDWEQQDALIYTWLFSTIADFILLKLVDCTYSWQVWSEVQRYFNTLLTTKARQLRSELRNLTKGSRTITEFMIRVRDISESLVSIADPVPQRNLIEIVLDALPEEYDPIVDAMNNKEDLSTIEELESSILAHESRLEKNRKVVVTEPISVNLAQTPPSSQSFSTEASGVDTASNFPVDTSHVNANADSNGYGSRGGRSGRGGGRFGRGGGRSGKVSCQICHKPGHEAFICYHRYSSSGAPSYPSPRTPFNPFMMMPHSPYPPSAFGYAPAPRPTPPRQPQP